MSKNKIVNGSKQNIQWEQKQEQNRYQDQGLAISLGEEKEFELVLEWEQE